MKIKAIYSSVSLLILMVVNCVPSQVSTGTDYPKLNYTDENYRDNVGIAFFNPDKFSDGLYRPPVMKLGEQWQFSFDVLSEEFEYYNLRILHCTYDWRPSRLPYAEYLGTFNLFDIDNYQYGGVAAHPYVNYSISVPNILKSGNYLFVVCSDVNDDDIVLSRRVQVIDQQVTLKGEIKSSNSIINRATHQRIEFSVNYSSVEVFNPMTDFKVLILQNHNWGKAIYNIRPSSSRIDKKTLYFAPFDGSNEFAGTNEFRFIDIRTGMYRGMNISETKLEGNKILAVTDINKPRGQGARSQLFKDRNGGFQIQSIDPLHGDTQSDYLNVTFRLEIDEDMNQPVHVVGAFNDWITSKENEMKMLDGLHQVELLLKQGIYDYQYTSFGQGQRIIEGDFFETENVYEIFVYKADPVKGIDTLIGYTTLSSGL